MDAGVKLKLFNSSLRLLGEGALSSLTENREPQRLLTALFDDDWIDACLEEGLWKHACRTQQIDFEASITPSFGYRRAFTLPDDYIRMVNISADEYFSLSLLAYREEAGYIWSDCDTIYLSYISNDVLYGNDTSIWPKTFKKYVESHGAAEICERVLQNDTKEAKIYKIRQRRLTNARSKAAMEDPTKFPPVGTWVTARRAGRVSRRDNGSRGNLYG